MTVAEARDSVTMLIGELFELASFIKEMGGDEEVEIVTDLEQTMKAYEGVSMKRSHNLQSKQGLRRKE